MNKLEKEVEYYPNSQIVWTENQVNNKGEWHGYFKRYDFNGKLNAYCNFINDSRVGVGMYYKNGRAYIFDCHIKGERHGIEIEFKYSRKKKK